MERGLRVTDFDTSLKIQNRVSFLHIVFFHLYISRSRAPHSASSSSIELFHGALCIPHSPPFPFSFLELSVNPKVQDEKFLVDCSIGSASEFRGAGGSSSRRF
ncbi:hypothetical protein AAC387_Pa02g5109 [Persea americana]